MIYIKNILLIGWQFNDFENRSMTLDFTLFYIEYLYFLDKYVNVNYNKFLYKFKTFSDT